MCGIVGFTGDSDAPLLRKMTAALTHRGPDGEGFLENSAVNFGMRRLAIVDIEHGAQPVSNETGSVWSVFNGEIYNHVVLRSSLEAGGHRFRSHHSDTETIVHLYEEYGEMWPEKAAVNGMFGVAIWDDARRRLLLYRDRIGKKPLFYARAGRDLVFASEVRALLLHPAISRELDSVALWHYFGMKNVSAPRTAFRSIRQLLPGEYLAWEDGVVRTGQYASQDFPPPGHTTPPEEFASRIRELLEDAVRIRMQCDAPFGAFLSGGVDSTVVATLMARHHSRPILTFSLVYEDHSGVPTGKHEDRRWARQVAARIGSEHHEEVFRPADVPAHLADIERSFEGPFSGTISTFFLARLMRRHIKVALSGDGADELFGSYLAHRLAVPTATAAAGGPIHPFPGSSGLDGDPEFIRRIAHADPGVWRENLDVFPESERLKLLSPAFLKLLGEQPPSLHRSFSRGATGHDPLNVVLEMDQKELLANQVLPFVDRLSMAHSIEIRVPFLDHRIVALANAIPGKMKIHDGIVKSILRRAVADLVPAEILARPKEGFVQPVYGWMRGPLAAWLRDCVEPARLAGHGFIRPEYAAEIVDDFLAGNDKRAAQAWSLACFQNWWDTLSMS